MNIEQANTIPIVEILEKLGCVPIKVIKNDYWFRSPLRDEKTASFKVNALKNVWYDFGEGKGGDAISFVGAYLQSTHQANTVHDALRWISNMAGAPTLAKPVAFIKKKDPQPVLILKDIQELNHRALIGYLQSRGISSLLASRYFKQLRLFNTETKKNFFALGFQNEDENFEVRTPFLKSCLGSKTISFIRGVDTKDKGIHLFEGCMDFLSVLADKKLLQLNDDAIVLNSTSCLRFALPYIKNYGYRVAYSWFDNDIAGRKAKDILADFIATEQDLKHQPMNDKYSANKDVNAWYTDKLGLLTS